MTTNSKLAHRYLNQVIEAYTQKVAPLIRTRKNKALTIGAAIVLFLVYKINKSLKPPKNLAHIPYIGYVSYFRSMFVESAHARIQRYILPLISSEGSNGIFLIPRDTWEVHVTNPEDVKKVFLKSDIFQKDPSILKPDHTLFYKFMGGPSLLNVSGQQWKNQRKVVNPAFHRSMPVQLFGNLTINLFKEIEKKNTGEIDISDLVERWTLEAIGKAGFDFDFNALTDKNSYWVNTYNTIMKSAFSPVYVVLPFIDNHLLWMFPKRKHVHRDMDNFLNTINTIIDEKRKKIQNGENSNDALRENEKDLLTLMLESEMTEDGTMTNEELKSNICLFFLAGHDTTSSAISTAIYYLSIYQDIQQRAREEAIFILGDEPEDIIPTIEDINKLHYIGMIIKEVLRTDSPIDDAQVRVANEDTELGGTFIPKGTQVSVNISLTHLSDKNWTDPFSFNPDRFSDKQQASGKNMNWIPFGNGGRQCIGMKFSLAEQKVFLCMLLRKYTWSLPENSIHKNGLKTKGFGLVSPRDLYIDFKKRY